MRLLQSFAVCLLWALSLGLAAGEATEVSVHDAWIRQAPLGVRVMAGYMELRNHSSRPQVLVAASSSGFESVMIHRTVVRQGVAQMLHASQLELAPKSNLRFVPGGYHLMLLKPKQALRVGEPVLIKLEFRGGLAIPVAFEVRK